MRVRLVIGAGAAAVVAFSAAASAQAAPLLITGGGQVLADSNPASEPGPGDTIAFVAEQTGADDTANNARGSLEVVNTSEARAGQRPTVIFNGEVTCIRSPQDEDDASVARFGGVIRTGQGPTPFVVDVVDTGDENRGTDMIEFRQSDNQADPCEDSEEGTVLNGTTLARGNLKIDTASSGR